MIATLSETSWRISLSLGHSLWQGLAILIGAWIAAAAIRRPAGKYLVYLFALMLMVACLPVNYACLAGKSLEPPTAETVLAPVRPLEAPDESSPVAIEQAEEVATAPGGFQANHILTGMSALYATGVLLMLLRLVCALYGGSRLTRASQSADSRLLAALGRQARRLAIGTPPDLLICHRVSIPVVVGVIRPAILLPLSVAAELSMDQVEMILAHELAHIRRRDHWTNLFQRLAEAVLFFHPATWLLVRRLEKLREFSCDDLVIQTGSEPAAYAQSLVRVSELRGRSIAALAATGQNGSQLRERVLRLIDSPVPLDARLTGKGLAAALLLLSFCLAPVAMKQAWSASTDNLAALADEAADKDPENQKRNEIKAAEPGTSKPVDKNPGGDEAGKPAKSKEERSGSLQGVVRGLDGKLAKDYVVALDHEKWTNRLGDLPHQTTRADGTFVFRELPAGTCKLIVRPRGNRPTHQLVVSEIVIRSKETGKVAIDLHSRYKISGQVRRLAKNQHQIPVPNMRVRSTWKNRKGRHLLTVWSITDATGRYISRSPYQQCTYVNLDGGYRLPKAKRDLEARRDDLDFVLPVDHKPRQDTSLVEQLWQRLGGKSLKSKRKISELSDLFFSNNGFSYQKRDEVVTVISALDGEVLFLPKKSIFYIRRDPLGSARRSYYGPFPGDPRKLVRVNRMEQVIVTVDIKADNSLWVNQRRCAVAELAKLLKETKAKAKSVKLRIHADSQARYDRVVAVLNLAAAANLKDIRFSTPEAAVAWQPYSTAGLAKQRAQGKAAIVWVRADWCAVCRVIEKTVWKKKAVIDLIDKRKIVAYRMDLTKGRDALKSLKWQPKQTPGLIVFPPGGQKPVIVSGPFNEAAIVAALRRVQSLKVDRF